MAPGFNMDTPKVLKECLDLFASPNYEKYPVSIQSNDNKYGDHPDVQYFKRIKAKNHYNYHKFKKTPKKSSQNSQISTSTFDPFSRDQLLERLHTYSPLNWNIPLEETHELTELKCAQNGWKCVSVSVNSYAKNHLMCTACMRFLTLRFNESGHGSSNSNTEFNMEPESDSDNDELNLHISTSYLDDIIINGHDSNCPWRNFETPLDGVYYIKPYIDSSDELLISSYLSNLHDLVENKSVIINKAENFQCLLDSKYNSDILPPFIKASNTLLLDKFYYDDKENKTSVLESIPPWFYLTALLGWDLKIQSFAHHLVLFLTCGDCNKKLFLDRAAHPQVHRDMGVPVSTGLNLSTSKVLTPVKFPPSNLKSSFVDQFDNEEEEDGEGFDLFNEHKCWCLKRKSINDSETFTDYVFNIILQTQSDDMEADNVPTTPKRRNEFDVKEGLERLNKLRKLYLDD